MGTRKSLLFGIVVVVLVGAFLVFHKPATPPVTPAAAPAPKPTAPTIPPPPPAPKPEPAAAPTPPAPAPVATAAPEPPKPTTSPSSITEATLVNTKWGPKTAPEKAHGKAIEFEFAPDHVLKIGGNNRAKWRIEGQQIVMYSDDGETHVLDIVNGKIMFQGEELQKGS